MQIENIFLNSSFMICCCFMPSLLSQCIGAPQGLGLAWGDTAPMGPTSLVLD